MQPSRLEYLFFRYYNKTATDAEKSEFMDLMQLPECQEAVQPLIQEVLRSEQKLIPLDPETSGDILSSILNVTRERPLAEEPADSYEYRRRPASFPWKKLLAAASLIGIAGFLGYFLRPQVGRPGSMDRQATAVDFLPGTTKARLALSDGTLVELDSGRQESVLNRHGIGLDLAKGVLTYHKRRRIQGYHTLTTPRGGQYKIILPDGSSAWLNAGSSLKFPTTFDQADRRVEMSGEIYFEVTKDSRRPFFVTVTNSAGRKTEVRVLGTHFNVSSYDDDPALQATLLEGSVEIKQDGASRILVPGQQARISREKETPGIEVADVDAASVIAWTEGRFEFNTDIRDIMRQISRWYDVEIEYEDNVPEKSFVGVISRKSNVSEVLKVFELTGGIRFRTEDHKIIVMPGDNR